MRLCVYARVFVCDYVIVFEGKFVVVFVVVVVVCCCLLLCVCVCVCVCVFMPRLYNAGVHV